MITQANVAEYGNDRGFVLWMWESQIFQELVCLAKKKIPDELMEMEVSKHRNKLCAFET